jgi:hypothetical protein
MTFEDLLEQATVHAEMHANKETWHKVAVALENHGSHTLPFLSQELSLNPYHLIETAIAEGRYRIGAIAGMACFINPHLAEGQVVFYDS